jgi:indolepyruvate decarboxylase
MEKITVVNYLMKRLAELGVNDVFGVPGDYNFHIIDAIEANENLKWTGCCNELNAGYAADGYARMKGIGAIVTTFGVGELSAVNAIAGCYSESVPVIKIVGSPDSTMQKEHALLHHTLIDGNFEFSLNVYKQITAATAVLTPENAFDEIERVLETAVNTKKPVYISIAKDVCEQFAVGEPKPFVPPKSDENVLNSVADEIAGMLNKAKNPVIIADAGVSRHNLKAQVKLLIEKAGYPYAILFSGKNSVDETLPNYIGLYMGDLINPETRAIVESSDCILMIGATLADYNTGFFTAKLDFSKLISINNNSITVGKTGYENVLMKDLIIKLTEKLSHREEVIPRIKTALSLPAAEPHSGLSAEYIYPRMQEFLKSGDTVVVDSGTLAIGFAQVKLPPECAFIVQVLWGSIGWATPAAFGVGISDKNRRVILLTGDGSFQLTAQEVSSMMRYGLKPIIILLNNQGYTIERLLSPNPMDMYNEIANWNYTKLPEAFGGKAFVVQARTNEEFDNALKQAEMEQANQLCFIEIFADKMDAPALAKRLGEAVMRQESE